MSNLAIARIRYHRVGCVLALLAGATLQLSCAPPAPKEVSYTKPDDDPNWKAGCEKPPSSNTYYRMAKLLVAQGKDPQARIILQKLLDQDPKFMPAYVELAQVHMRQRQADLAIRVLASGLVHSPNDTVLLNNIGMCHLLQGQYDQAQSNFQKACAIKPDDARSRSNMAVALGMKGRYGEALALYEQILSPGEAHYNLAVLAQARNDTSTALMEFDKASQLGYRSSAGR